MSGSITYYSAVALGSALGAMMRYLVSVWFLVMLGPAFPWGTLAVNMVGSALIGLVSTLTRPDGLWKVPPWISQFLISGFCGGFTTFSLFSLEVLTLAEQGVWWLALGYLLASLGLWTLGVLGGVHLGETMNRRQRAAG